MNDLKINAPKTGADFILIAGDNYYPDKTVSLDGKVKTLSKPNLLSGFNCLNAIPLPKYLLLGNHELDNEITNIVPMQNNTNNNILDCKIIRMQKNIVAKTKEIPENEITMFENEITMFENVMHRYDAESSTLLIMIDTTLYELFSELNENENGAACYREIELGKEEGKLLNISEMIAKQAEFVDEALNEFQIAKTIIFAGHHPIIGVKGPKEKEKKEKKEKKDKGTENLASVSESVLEEKKEKKKDKTPETSDGLIKLLMSKFDLLKDKNLIYLCADVHLYQEGIITIIKKKSDQSDQSYQSLNIKQYIVGTGGAELDELCNKEITYKKELSDSNITYNIQTNTKTYGYLVCNTSANTEENTFEFVNLGLPPQIASVSTNASMPGGYKKMKKTKKSKNSKKSKNFKKSKKSKKTKKTKKMNRSRHQ
jgi:hypothetical protein